MRRVSQLLLVSGSLLLAASARPAASGPQAGSRGYAADSAAIRAAIERGAVGFMRAEPDLILAHYAPDIILSYPGIPDQDYGALVKAYGELRKGPRA